MSLRASVKEALRVHGIDAAADDDPAALRERLNDVYLEEVRVLRTRQRSGEIPLREYATHVDALKNRFPLLSLRLPEWSD